MKNMYKCETLTRRVLPLYRSFVAKELLSKYNFTQVKVAKKLGTTQAAISQYLNSKRGRKENSDSKEYIKIIKNAAENIAKLLATTDIGSEEFKGSFCDLCTKLQNSNKLS
jgi:predicted transcriptional regulator